MTQPSRTPIQHAAETLSAEIHGLEALRTALAGELGASFAKAVDTIANAHGRVIVTGVGKSGHIARKLAATFASTGKPSHFVHPSDASHGDLGMILAEDVVLALSWSGESSELSHIVQHTRRYNVPLIASTGNANSTLAHAADITLALPPCEEACNDLLAPTTTTTMQLALGDALAVSLVNLTNFSAEDFHALHPGGQLGSRLLRVKALMHSSNEVPLIHEDALLSEAIVRMTSGRFGITGVVNTNGTLIGAITDGDLRRAFTQGFHDRAAKNVMHRNPYTVHPDELAHKALARINAQSITSLFVVENENIIGILHIHDLLRAGLM